MFRAYATCDLYFLTDAKNKYTRVTAAGQSSQSSLAGIPATLLCQLLSESRQHRRTLTVRTYIVIPSLTIQEKPPSKQHGKVPLIPKSSYQVSHQAETSISRETSCEHSKAVSQPKEGRSLPMPMWNWLCMDKPDRLCTLG